MSEQLRELFIQKFGVPPTSSVAISAHASPRKLIRFTTEAVSVIGVDSENLAENNTFIAFARHFRKFDLPVPEIVAISNDTRYYLQQDLGDQTLFDILNAERKADGQLSLRTENLYSEAVRLLSYFQVEAGRSLDYSLCTEGSLYDQNAMLFDCNRFLSELVKRMGISFDTVRIASDFEQLTKFLSLADTGYFLYRDFQSRNIMVLGEQLYFIDFQSGRHGALQYDLASLLYQSQARLPEDFRERVIASYLQQLTLRVSINRDQFLEYLDGFVLIRLLQVLGAYGKLGLGENKEYFRKGIPFAVATFLQVLGRQRLPIRIPEITAVFARLTDHLHT